MESNFKELIQLNNLFAGLSLLNLERGRAAIAPFPTQAYED